MGANDVLYVFSTVFKQMRLDKAVKMSPRWWLLSPKTDSPDVKQILLSIGKPISQGRSLGSTSVSKRVFTNQQQ